MTKKLTIIFSSLFLLAIAAIVVYSKTIPQSEPKINVPLGEIIPKAVPGWDVVDMELGNTEYYRNTSSDILNFDDYIYRSYSTDELSFSIYAAHWTPGKMPVRYVQSHTPDRCWTTAGMSILEFKNSQDIGIEDVDYMPVEWRIFEDATHNQIYVYYWHVVGDEVHSMDGIYNKHTSLFERIKKTLFKDMLSLSINQVKEQFFVRIASVHSFDELKKEKAFLDAVKALKPICGVTEQVI